MSREEIVNNIGYQLTRAAVNYIEKHEFADGMDCFEAGAEWMQKKIMENKINITVTLKDCHKGTKLYSPIFGDVYLEKIRPNLAVVVTTESNDKEEFLYDGRYGINGECVLFPSKENRDWSTFQRPFKDGDVVSAIIRGKLWYGIYKKEFDRELYCYVSYSTVTKSIYQQSKTCEINSISEMHFATEEEKEKFFKAIKDNGYRWNPESKTLEKLPKFKDGDVIANNTRIVISHKLDKIPNSIRNDVVYYHCRCRKESNDSKFKIDFGIVYASDFRFATEEEKQILFDVIKANGYRWNEETKTLKKLVEPQFKIGDRVKEKKSYISGIITDIDDDSYKVEYKNGGMSFFSIKFQNDLELVPNKFDINTLKPFDKVLVRDNNAQKWTADLFSFFDKSLIYPYSCVGHYTNQCIPYEGNEHLLNTTDDCDEFYKNW